jgi:hypothetical protein
MRGYANANRNSGTISRSMKLTEDQEKAFRASQAWKSACRMQALVKQKRAHSDSVHEYERDSQAW